MVVLLLLSLRAGGVNRIHKQRELLCVSGTSFVFFFSCGGCETGTSVTPDNLVLNHVGLSVEDMCS